MKAEIEEAGPCRKILRVDAPADAVIPEYDRIVNEFAAVARVPGFRPGRAPVAVVEKRFAKSIVEETKDRLVPKFYREALKERSVNPVSIVEVSEVAFDKADGISFKVTVDVAPDFKLPKYTKIKLKENEAKVDDAEVEKSLGELRERLARFEDVSGRASSDGDLVQVDYRSECEGKPVGAGVPDCAGLGEGKDFWVLLGEPEFLPGFRAGLAGMQVDEERQVQVAFPADYHVKAVAGKVATYTVKLKAIRQKVLPALDAEFLKRFEVENESGLREKIRAELLVAATESEKNRLKDEIAKFLIEKTELDLPQSVVEQETELIARDMVQRSVMQGATREQILEQRDNILSAATRSSAERVKLAYILSRIADEEKIEVADADVDARIEAMARRYRTPAEKLKADLEKRNRIEGLRTEVRAEKTMDLLLEKARVK